MERARKNYDLNAAGKYVRKKAYRECDYTPEGHLRQFETDTAFYAFEEERFQNGQIQAAYSSKPKNTVPREQLALEYLEKERALNGNAIKEEGQEIREQQEQLAESLQERYDQQDAKLDQLLAMAEGKLNRQLELAEKRKQQNEAFVARVDSGGLHRQPLPRQLLR